MSLQLSAQGAPPKMHFQIRGEPESGLDRSAGTTNAPAAAPVVTRKKSDSAMTGFVRLVAESPEAGGYVSKAADPRYRILLTCTELADAARVRLIPLTSSYGIQLLVGIFLFLLFLTA